jgi:ATP-binding cassette subfamily B protein
MTALALALWDVGSLAAALDALAERAGIPNERRSSTPGRAVVAEDELTEWIHGAAAAAGVELVERPLAHGELEAFFRTCGFALVSFGTEPARFLAVLGTRRRSVVLLAPDLKERRFPLSELAEAFRRDMHAPLEPLVERLIEAAAVSVGRRADARRRILENWIGARRVSTYWLLRLPPGSSFIRQFHSARLPRALALFVTSWFANTVGWIGSWWLIGRGALEGHLATGWLIAWALLLVTLVPLRMAAGWAQGTLAIGLGGLLRTRLFAGTFRLKPDETRHLGFGELLGRVMDCGAVEAGILNGGFLSIVSFFEICLASWVLSQGAGGASQVALLAGCIAATAVLGWSAFLNIKRTTGSRLSLTGEMFENMVGHRTRLAQEPPEQWHARDDVILEKYLTRCRGSDRSMSYLSAVVPQGWMLASLLVLAPHFVAGASVAAIAIALGGILLARGALSRLVTSFWIVASTAVAWRNAGALFRAPSRKDWPGRPEIPPRASTGEDVVLSAQHLFYRHDRKGATAIHDCSLRLHRGDRVLLQGPSGSGKSTLAALLSGLREPESGMVLLDGLDQRVVGGHLWRKRIVVVPQFHENHIFSASLAFNLLMGRRWPPRKDDLDEATEVCRQLGLGPLMARMPAGLSQKVGDIGWQLSHGEKSRVFVARALLQGGSVLIFDESFASLDPETLDQAFALVEQRAPSLIVIAHP